MGDIHDPDDSRRAGLPGEQRRFLSGPDESLVPDVRADLRPADFVSRKLSSTLNGDVAAARPTFRPGNFRR